MTHASPDGWVENPPHVDPVRVQHISTADLLAAVGMPNTTISVLRERMVADHFQPVWSPWAIEAASLDERERAIAAADQLRERHIDFTDPAVGKSQLYGLNYLGALLPLVQAYVLTGEEANIRTWERHFTAWYGSRGKAVGGWPGLDAVWYSLGVWARAQHIVAALSVFTPSSALSDETFIRALATVVGGARWATEEHERFRHGNWQLVCALELFHVAAFLPQAPEREQWLAVAQGRRDDHLELDFYSDGGHYERAPGYHDMCLVALQRAAIVAEQYLELDLTTQPRFAAAHHWLAEMATPQGWVPHWQDSAFVWPALSLLRGSYLLDDPELASRVRRWLPRPEIERVLATLPRRPGREEPLAEFDSLPPAEIVNGSRNLSGSGYVVLTGPGADDPYLGLNAGPWAEHELESHSHDAVLDIVVSLGGRPLIWDAGGPPNYDDPGYHDWYHGGRGHSGVTVPGRSLSHDRQVRVELFETAELADVARATHRGYGPTVTRQIVAVHGSAPYYLITDTVDDPELPWEWAALSPNRWTRTPDGYQAGPSAGNGPGVLVLPSEDAHAHFDSGSGRIPGMDGAAPYRDLHVLRLRPTGTRLVTLIAPFAQTVPAWQFRADGSTWLVTGHGFVDRFAEDRLRRETTGGRTLSTVDW